MIRGVVNHRREAVINLTIRAPDGIELAFDVVIDTGFTGTIIMPPSLIASLGLIQQSSSWGNLADGTARLMGQYDAEILWDGSWRPIIVMELNGQALLGMKFLEGHELRISVRAGGPVVIAPGAGDETDYDDVMIV